MTTRMEQLNIVTGEWETYGFSEVKKPQIRIALVGGARVGKDTIANYIISVYGNGRKYAFADKLKEVYADVFMTLEKEREGLITLGNTVRSISPDAWVKHLALEFLVSNSAYGIVILTDVRFQNEVDWAISQGFTLVKVVSEKQKERALEGGEILDADNDGDKFAQHYQTNLTIENSGSVGELYEQIETLMSSEFNREVGE